MDSTTGSDGLVSSVGEPFPPWPDPWEGGPEVPARGRRGRGFFRAARVGAAWLVALAVHWFGPGGA